MTGDATAAVWIDAHKRLQAIAKPGDIFVFGDSGHGSTYETILTMAGGTAFCFYERQIKEVEQHKLMTGWPEGVLVIYVYDCCHSAGLKSRELQPHIIRAAPIWLNKGMESQPQFDPKSGDIKAAIIELAACKQTETAADGPQNGAFTGSILDIWQQSQEQDVTLACQPWFDGVSQEMATNFPSQHPVLTTLGAGSNYLNTPISD